jgi:hypothetical protein
MSTEMFALVAMLPTGVMTADFVTQEKEHRTPQ